MNVNNNDRSVNAVYYVSARGLPPLAIRPEIKADNIHWDNTESRGISKHFDDIMITPSDSSVEKSTPRVIIFLDKAEMVTLTLLTREIFDENVKSRVAGGNEMHFDSDAALQDYYLKTNFN